MKKSLFILSLLYIGLHTTPCEGAEAFRSSDACVAESVSLASEGSSMASESLSYTLYFNWKFVWIKAGRASLTTRSTTYKGQPAIESTLLAQSANTAEHIYHLSDTLRTIVTPDIEPLYFVKHCEEGDDIVYERAWFSRTPAGRYRADISKVYPDGKERKADYEGDAPVYDMISVMLHARTLPFATLSKGRRLTYPVAGGRRVDMQTLVYMGRETVKTQAGKDVATHVFSLVSPKTKDGLTTEVEVLRFYISDDPAHTPVQIDLNLKFGTAKAKLN